MEEKLYEKQGIRLKYYEIQNDHQPLVFLHAQGVDGKNYANVAKPLSKKFHIYSVDCYGHGGSLHRPEEYNIKAIGTAILYFIENQIGQKVWLAGHSSGGLIAAYIASETNLCERLILEDPPFFASQGERRKSTFNYIDLSTICHTYVTQKETSDFVLYYFSHQYLWNFFPEESREKIKGKLMKMATAYRTRHPEKDLKVPFWPKAALAGLQGMNHYDPLFGEAFYNDSFHCGIPHEKILEKITCKTIFMKAQTKTDSNGLLMGALKDEDVQRVSELIGNCKIVPFDCGHGIHVEKPKEFVKCLLNL